MQGGADSGGRYREKVISGTLDIQSKEDGLKGKDAVVIRGGQIDIQAGQIRAVAQDGGINSAGTAETEWEKMQDQDGVYTRIAGGEIWLDASADGIDSNGDLYMEGGTLYLSGPVSDGEGILDYNGTATITGGTVIAAGGSGMMQIFSEESTQNYLVVYYTEKQEAGTAVQLQSADGTVLAEYAPGKDFTAVILSSQMRM